MDAKTPVDQLIETQDLAIGIQVSAQVGPNRSISMTLGVPLNWGTEKVNAHLDRIMEIADRQNNKGILEQHRLALEKAEKDIGTAREHRADYIDKAAKDWDARGRHGEFKMSESQRQQVANFETTEKNLRENIIPRLREQIAELERKIRGE